MQILVVDDEAAIAELLSAMCRRDGHDVIVCTSSRDARAQLEAGAFDLLITDIVMPPPDGLQLVREARALHPKLMAIAVTGYTGRHTLSEALTAGASELMFKPLRMSDVRTRVAVAAERHRANALAEEHAEAREAATLPEKRLLAEIEHIRQQQLRIRDDLVAHEALLKDRIRFVHDAAGIGIWELELATGVITWSEAMPAMHGLADGVFAGTVGAFFDLVHPDDREAVRDAQAAAIAAGDDFSMEFRIVWPDGSIHWLDTRNQVRRMPDGRPDRVIGVVIDVTERRALEAQLRQAQKMEAIGQLAGGVAHDFKNLLTVILGYAEFIADEAGHSDQHQRDVREIITAAHRAVGLTTQLLAFSRKQVLQSTLLDVNALVVETSETLRRLIGDDIELITALAPDVGSVFADEGQMQQVLINLASNARDAMSQGGRLAIETAEVQLDRLSGLHDQEVVPGRYVMLSVTDSGTGMDAETKRRLFEPFFSTKDQGKGTGLGLATVYGIVKQSGGYVWMDSMPGQGATFKVYLPRSTAGPQPDITATVVDLSLRGAETVLLVEDEDGVRRLAQRILENAGYHVLLAANAVEATELFARHRDAIDLVVTDVVMPGASGPILIQQLTLLRPGLKSLYMSGYNEDAIVRQARLERGLPFVQKPFTAAVLARVVREVLNS